MLVGRYRPTGATPKAHDLGGFFQGIVTMSRSEEDESSTLQARGLGVGIQSVSGYED